MMRTLLLALLSLFLTFWPVADCMGGSITYNIQNYPAFQNGYKLSGTITTDGHIGVLGANDITAWAFTVSGGPKAFSLNSSQLISSASVVNLVASASALSLADPGPATQNYLELSYYNGNTLSLIIWNEGEGGAGAGQPNGYLAQSFGTNVWSTNPSDTALGGAPWLIATATVPEPGSLTLALLGSACLAVVQWARRCRRVAGVPLAIPAHS